jgi:4-hydroxy-3-polyprenylbenzoate decarboxylase
MLPPSAGLVTEGPFGEVSGYYGGGARPLPITRFHSILMRRDPILFGEPPFHGLGRGVLQSRSTITWSELERLGIPGIVGVNQRWGMCIIAVKQAHPGHAMRAALGALGGTAGYHGRFVILVDEDVNPYDMDEVLWAVATRCDPQSQIDINRRIWSYRLDPRLAPERKDQGDFTGSVAIIDACRPIHWKEAFPKTTQIEPDTRRATEEKWGWVFR